MDVLNVSHLANTTTPYRCNINEDFKYILRPVCYSVVLVVGLALNLTALYSILFRIKRWSPNTIFMVNLSVCDTLYILTLPFLIYYHAKGNDWPFTEAFCKLIRFLFYTNLYGSILFLTCISVHRFLGVCHPVRAIHWVNARRARIVCGLIWTVLLICQLPVLYFVRTKQKVCLDTTSNDLFNYFLIYSSIIMLLFFVIPFAVVLVCNSLIVETLLRPTPVGGSVSQRSKQRSVKMIVIVLLVFILCFLPFHLTRSFHYFVRYLHLNCTLQKASNLPYKISRLLATTNSCIDPILYFLAGQSFRQSLQNANKQNQKEKDEDKYLSTSV